jgi:hypothetical protein
MDVTMELAKAQETVLELYSKSLKKSYIHMPKLSFHAQIMKWV